jgi:hypothetical protein
MLCSVETIRKDDCRCSCMISHEIHICEFYDEGKSRGVWGIDKQFHRLTCEKQCRKQRYVELKGRYCERFECPSYYEDYVA